jgi:ribonuclease P protein component
VPGRHVESFHKSNRLRKRPDFRRVQGQGKRLRTPRLLVMVQPSKGPSNRFGLTVSRKVGNAVTRNRVKRWLREAIRRNHHQVDGPVDVVFIARREAADAGLAVLSEEVIDMFSRIGGKS